METKALSKELLQKIQEKLQESKLEFYWNYNDELNEEQIVKILNGKFNEVESELWEYNADSGNLYRMEKEHIKDTLEKFSTEIEGETGEEFDAEDLHDDLRDSLIDFVNIDMDMRQLIKNTGNSNIRVEMLSNYDCINSHWFETNGFSGGYSYTESYFGAMVDALYLNPAKVKEMLLEHDLKAYGRFPNKPHRDGNEYVSYEDFYQELDNSSCGANSLVFTAKVNLEDLYSDTENLKPIAVTIPAGNNCGIYSSFQGGGSVMSMKLLRPITLDLVKKGKTEYDSFRLISELDKDGGYTIDNVYGMTREFWGKDAIFKTEKVEL